MISSNKKLLRCPMCNSKPHLWKIDSSCGYVICPICNLSTKRYDDFIESWQKQATDAWNEMAESDKGVLEKLSEDQDTLLKTCSEWDKAIEKRGYVE